MWHLHLKQGLLDRGFKPSQVDPCVFVKDQLILVIYMDDVIAFCPDEQPIQDFIKSMQEAEPNKFILEDMGSLKDYLGIKIVEKDKRIYMTQMHLINKIISTAN